MHLSLNGSIVERASINAASSGSLYGKGVFTTIAFRDSEPFLWGKHWRRLSSNASRLSIDISGHPETNVLAWLSELISGSGVTSGRARLTVFDGSSSPIWQIPADQGTSLLITLAEPRPRSNGSSVTSSIYLLNSASPLAGVKSCNYLEHLMAYEEARGRGFDEAIRMNEKGRVASACMANVFWETGGKLYTPSLSTGCLAGTTREFVLENSECEEVEAGIEALESADRIFLTSAGIGITPVSEFNGRRLDVSEHPVTDLLPI
jgi:branched-chain amino acid aminotransferase